VTDYLFSRPPDKIRAPEKFYTSMTREEKIEATLLVRQIVGNMRRNKIHPEDRPRNEHPKERMDRFEINRGVVRNVINQGQISKVDQEGVVTLKLPHPQPKRSAEMVYVVVDLVNGTLVTVHVLFPRSDAPKSKPPKPYEDHVKNILKPIVDMWKRKP
jgi:hypothetical protein